MIGAVNPEFILFNLENVSKKFRNLSAPKQTRWLQVLRAAVEGDNVEDILETLVKMDAVQLQHFMKLCKDRGIYHVFNKEELVEMLSKMDTNSKKEALEESDYIPSLRHLIYILKNMDEYELIRAIRTANISVAPTLEEAICTAGQYSHEDVSRVACRLGVCLINENDVIAYVMGLTDSMTIICNIIFLNYKQMIK